MIVEDENGHDIDLRDLDDNREPEPPDEHEEPLDLDEIAKRAESLSALDLGRLNADAETMRDFLDFDVPALLEEVEDLRQGWKQLHEQLTYWRELPTRQEYAITDGPHPDQASVIWHGSAEDALRLAEDPARKGWVRKVMVHPWQSLNEPPF